MDNLTAGDLVRLVGAGPVLDGIVFDTPNRSKVMVAVVDPGRGPVFRSVHPGSLTARDQEGPDDVALRRLIRRTTPAVRGVSRGGANVGKGAAGFSRGASHRTTGR